MIKLDKKVKYYLFLIFSLFLLVSVPLFLLDGLRRITISVLTVGRKNSLSDDKSYSYLLLENQHLKSKIQHLQDLLVQKQVVEREILDCLSLAEDEMFQNEQKRSFSPLFYARSARVICRETNSWNRICWINVGGKGIVKNSPVVLGRSVVGLIDYVGKKQSRVRLITDPSIQIAVQTPSFSTRGILRGCGSILWRSTSQLLRGVGFNSKNFDLSSNATKALKEENLLITTGLDGIFPQGLHVATVSKILSSEESYACEIEAKPTVKNFNNIKTVFVLPPMSQLKRP